MLRSTNTRAFLIEAEKVAGGIAKGGDPRRIAGGIGPRRRNDCSALGCYLGERGVDIVDPDVGQQCRLAADFAAGDPSAADVAGGIIETRARCVTVTDIPAEYIFIEGSRLPRVDRGNFQVTDARAAQQLKAECGLRNRGAPLIGANVASVARKEPVVAIKVFNSVLAFAVFRDVEVCPRSWRRRLASCGSEHRHRRRTR